jgi:Aminoglycoside-2''-adenylyltransferase
VQVQWFIAICEGLSIQYWLRGGWAVDFYVGRITREHDDIDFFAWGIDAPGLARALEGAGFEPQHGNPPDAQRDFTKDGEDLQVALLARNDRGSIVVAGGPAAGAPWPDGVVTGPIGRLGHVMCPIVDPHAQIYIKQHFPEWRPDLPRY